MLFCFVALVSESLENISEENILLYLLRSVNNNTGGKTINIFSAILSIGESLIIFLLFAVFVLFSKERNTVLIYYV